MFGRWIMHLLTKHGKPKPWTVAEVQAFLKKVKWELDQGWHVYQLNRRVWAQKPHAKEGKKPLKRRRPATDLEESEESRRRSRDAREPEN